MKQQRHSVEQIIAKLRRADVELGKNRKVPEVCKMLEITEQTYYRWRQGESKGTGINSVRRNSLVLPPVQKRPFAVLRTKCDTRMTREIRVGF